MVKHLTAKHEAEDEKGLTCRKVGLMSAEDRTITETDSRPSAVSKRALSGDSLGCPVCGRDHL